MNKKTLLFLCTGNACRSQMAEGWGRFYATDDWDVVSAGVEVHGLNHIAVTVMAEAGLNITMHESTKMTDEMIAAADVVVTVCGHADELCPVLNEKTEKVHWPLEDPAKAAGSEEEVLDVFRSSRDDIGQRCKALLESLGVVQDGSFGSEDVKMLDCELGYKGFFQLEKCTVKHKLFAGGWSGDVVRERLVRTPAAAVLLYDAPQQKLVFVEQFRIGAIGQAAGPWCLELVAGIADKSESLMDLARREAEEEAGATIKEMRSIANYLVSPGGGNEQLFLFVGQVDSAGLGGIHGVEDECEDIRVKIVSVKDAYHMYEAGRFNNAATLVALQWLQLNKSALDADWR